MDTIKYKIVMASVDLLNESVGLFVTNQRQHENRSSSGVLKTSILRLVIFGFSVVYARLWGDYQCSVHLLFHFLLKIVLIAFVLELALEELNSDQIRAL